MTSGDVYLCREKETRAQTRPELPMIPIPLTVSSLDGASRERRPTDTQEGDEYDYIDDGDYEQPVTYEPLMDQSDSSPRVTTPYEVLGPDYLRIIGWINPRLARLN